MKSSLRNTLLTTMLYALTSWWCGEEKPQDTTNATTHILHVVLKDGKITTPNEPQKHYPYLHFIEKDILEVMWKDKHECVFNVIEVRDPRTSLNNGAIEPQADTFPRIDAYLASWCLPHKKNAP